ncbi:MAG: hypothetical protein IPM42_00320 [Saprospiraceae bacterium]|nr:hypothetical protein [Saprospiraceae bacterium]
MYKQLEEAVYLKSSARRINIQRVESLSYAGVTPGTISKLSAVADGLK